MKLCILGNSKKDKSDIALIESAKKVFDKVLFVPVSNVSIISEKGKIVVKYRETDLSNFDVILTKVSKSKYYLVNMILKSIENLYKVQREESFSILSNRLTLFQTLAKNRFKTPKICFADSTESAKRGAKEMKFPILVRVPTEPKKVIIATNEQEINSSIDMLKTLHQPIVLEEYRNDIDIYKVLVATKEVVWFKKKIGKCNSLPKNVENTAINITRTLGTDFAYIELTGNKNPIVIDVDLCPIIENKQLIEYILGKFKRYAELEKGGIIPKFIEDIKLIFKEIMS